MPSFASALELTLHKALEAASSRRHEYATLEHFLLALVDDEHASKVMSACGVDLGETQEYRRALSRHRARSAEGREFDRSVADQRLPARRPARHPPRPVLGPRRSDRRQRARRAVQRARELCRLFPPAAGHEPARRSELHQPRRRQGRHRSEHRIAPPRAPSEEKAPKPRTKAEARARARSSSSPSTSTRRRRRARSIR
jgi:hypothetical protein